MSRLCAECLQAYTSPAAALLSHQVLLALSPLHQQQLPQPELAALLPSSFGPVVGKVLMQQLGLGGVLQEFQHESAGQPQLWHVWWHIGIRRYHWVKQQQQGQQQQRQPTASSSSRVSSPAGGVAAGGDSSGLSRLSPAQLEALYTDPAAKYYAVGFAARQLCPDVAWLAPAAASSSSRHITLLEGLASQLLAACKLSYMRILHSCSNTSSDSEAGSAAVAAAVADAVSAITRNAAFVCVATAHALSPDAGSNSTSSSTSSYSSGSLDDLDAAEVPLEECWLAIKVRQQKMQLAMRCGSQRNGGGLREVMCCAAGVPEGGSGVAQAARLVPAPVELWVAPGRWCAVRGTLAREHVCSQCEEQPVQALRQLLVPAAWQAEEGLQAADGCCDDCCAFHFCSKECAGKCWRWHESLCKALTAVRKRYQRHPHPHPCCSHGILQGCNPCDACTPDSSSRAAQESDYAGYNWRDSCSGSSSGYQWPVMRLLQQGSPQLQGEQCIVDEPGPLGLNCCGLLDSHHMPDTSLVGELAAARRALKHAASVRHEALDVRTQMLAARVAEMLAIDA
ncbi:hypothetical protein COO60DRAFT_427501 [Scenedesmus sp. NREL 46B-D3]|nr:hypothetical protein COO60DRAFT_427501 [Scenedesmus sp. NREL 46B-D3]